MTQIINKKLKKCCDKCQSHLDKPCAWLSLGNEYCDEIMETQQVISQLTNNWNELEDYLNEQIQRSWEIEEQCYETILDKTKEIKENNE